MKKPFLTLLILLLNAAAAYANSFEYGYTKNPVKYVKHKYSEASYQQAWCKKHNGIMEYENNDKTRVDCLTDTYAVEFDFANKWAESVGQALHYSLMTGKKAKVVLILDNSKQMIYYKRVQKLADKYHFEVEYVTDEILNLDKDENCSCEEYKKNFTKKQI